MFTVKFMKYFVAGNLKGLSVDEAVNWPNLESAIRHTKFLLAHTSKPVEALNSSPYTVHVIRIETRYHNVQI